MLIVRNNFETQIVSPSPVELDLTVGNTPLLHLHRISKDISSSVKVLAKAEWFNPSGSIKDRPALNIIKSALTQGFLGNGKRLLDSTSGNMGISYATFGNALGIPVTLVLPANASPERMTILRALGAEIIKTDPLEGSDGAILEARRLVAEYPDKYYYANQYDNPANWHAHFQTTGPEIVDQTGGAVTHFVVGLGTSGTLMGSGRYLRQYNPTIRMIAVQPDSAFHGIEGLKYMPAAIRPRIYDPDLADEVIGVSTEDAYAMVRRLAIEEGLLVGISSGAAMAAALKIAKDLDEGQIVAIFPDSGHKYLSEKIWEK